MKTKKAKHNYKCHYCGKPINAGQMFIEIIVNSLIKRRFCLGCKSVVSQDYLQNKID